MPQSIHILRKDLRHLWPETLLVLALTAAYGLLLPNTWNHAADLSANFPLTSHQVQDLASIVTVLLPLSWLVLIARVTHAENLIGTRQFWLTRPYRWHSLLIARILFFALIILLPFFAAQASMLLHEHLPLAPFLAGLTFNLVLITIFFVLPFFTLATLCSSLLRIIGTILSTLVIVGAIFFFFNPLQGNSEDSIQLPDLVPFWLTLAALTCALLILLQFATRRLLLARALALLVAIGIFVLVVTPFEQHLIPVFYPAAANTSVRVTASSAEFIKNTYGRDDGVNLTLDVTGLAPGTHLVADDYLLTLQAPDGSIVKRPWASLSIGLPADDQHLTAYVQWPNDGFLRKHHAEPLTVGGEVAATLFHPQNTLHTTFKADQPTLVPDYGICQYPSKPNISWFYCSVPYSDPHVDRFSAPVDKLPCGSATGNPAASSQVSIWDGQRAYDIENLGFIPLRATGLYLRSTHQPFDYEPHEQPSAFCPGSIITVERYAVSERLRLTISPQPIILASPSENRTTTH